MDTECRLEDLPKVIADRDVFTRESQRESVLSAWFDDDDDDDVVTDIFTSQMISFFFFKHPVFLNSWVKNLWSRTIRNEI